MPTKKPGKRAHEETPRSDLRPVKEPYYEGYFGTDEEEGVVREEESGDAGGRPSDRDIAEDAAGGDREIVSPGTGKPAG